MGTRVLTANAAGGPAGAPCPLPQRGLPRRRLVEMVTACPRDAASSGPLPGMLLLGLLQNSVSLMSRNSILFFLNYTTFLQFDCPPTSESPAWGSPPYGTADAVPAVPAVGRQGVA